MTNREAKGLRCAGMFVFHAGKTNRPLPQSEKLFQLTLHLFGGQADFRYINVKVLSFVLRLIKRQLFDNEVIGAGT